MLWGKKINCQVMLLEIRKRTHRKKKKASHCVIKRKANMLVTLVIVRASIATQLYPRVKVIPRRSYRQ